MILWSVDQINVTVLQDTDGRKPTEFCVLVQTLNDHHFILSVWTFPVAELTVGVFDAICRSHDTYNHNQQRLQLIFLQYCFVLREKYPS